MTNLSVDKPKRISEEKMAACMVSEPKKKSKKRTKKILNAFFTVICAIQDVIQL